MMMMAVMMKILKRRTQEVQLQRRKKTPQMVRCEKT